ncbi:hypothetical protein ACH5RR_035208 [Cinchona calisaya]|uniref:Uncharacterized protein n=1 Tax=Cinchona calisaya TaxID=153742 RepID=A0ABD2YHL3_9GENT
MDDAALRAADPVQYWLDRSREAMLKKGMRVVRRPTVPFPCQPGVSIEKVERFLGVNIICDTCGNRMHEETNIHAIQDLYPKVYEGKRIDCYLTCNQCAADIVLAWDSENNVNHIVLYGATQFFEPSVQRPNTIQDFVRNHPADFLRTLNLQPQFSIYNPSSSSSETYDDSEEDEEADDDVDAGNESGKNAPREMFVYRNWQATARNRRLRR